MLRISKDSDILKYSDGIYAENTNLQRKIAAYELKGNQQEGPTLTPMQIDWKNLQSRWNNDLYDLFKDYAEEEGYGEDGEDEEMDINEEHELREIFFNRLKHLQAVINKNRPRPGETFDNAQRRIQARKDQVEGAKRRNSR